jgi:hypothetical protein
MTADPASTLIADARVLGGQRLRPASNVLLSGATIAVPAAGGPPVPWPTPRVLRLMCRRHQPACL